MTMTILMKNDWGILKMSGVFKTILYDLVGQHSFDSECFYKATLKTFL